MLCRLRSFARGHGDIAAEARRVAYQGRTPKDYVQRLPKNPVIPKWEAFVSGADFHVAEQEHGARCSGPRAAGSRVGNRQIDPRAAQPDPARPQNARAGKRCPPTKQLVLIVHHSPVMRVGLAALVRSSRAFRTCGEADEAPRARELFLRHHPDVVILGLGLSHGDGIELLKDFRRHDPCACAVVLTAREDPISFHRAFRAGARGYLLASDRADEVLRALAAVAAGEFYASPTAARRLLAALATGAIEPPPGELASLSDRELQIFRLIGSGFGATRVAAELRVSVKTIESHRTHIKEKLGLGSGAELNTRAARWVLDCVRDTRLLPARHIRAKHSFARARRGRLLLVSL